MTQHFRGFIDPPDQTELYHTSLLSEIWDLRKLNWRRMGELLHVFLFLGSCWQPDRGESRCIETKPGTTPFIHLLLPNFECTKNIHQSTDQSIKISRREKEMCKWINFQVAPSWAPYVMMRHMLPTMNFFVTFPRKKSISEFISFFSEVRSQNIPRQSIKRKDASARSRI